MADSGGAVGVSENCGTPCSKSYHLCKNHVTGQCGSGDDVAVCLEPITPDTTKDVGDVVSLDVSPLTFPENVRDVAHNLSSMGDDDDGRGSISMDNGSPITPKGSVFNTFTAGKRHALWTPHSKKLLDEISGCVTHCLNFGCPVVDIKDGTQTMDEEIIDSVYKNLLEAIALQQAKEILACSSSSGMVLSSCQTPTLLPLLNGIADTCPGAPVKSSMKSRAVDWGLRRKLEF